MTITMDDTQIKTLEQIEQVLESPRAIAFKGVRREQIYRWIELVLKRFDYFELNRKGKGLVREYLQRLSGLSRAQMTRLVLKCLLEGAIRPSRGRRNRFPAKYTNADKKLLALDGQRTRALIGSRDEAHLGAAALRLRRQTLRAVAGDLHSPNLSISQEPCLPVSRQS